MTRNTRVGTLNRPNERLRLRLTGPRRPFDPRQCAIRPDLIDLAEAPSHLAAHYAAAVALVCAAPFSPVCVAPDDNASAGSQILHGEVFHALDLRGGWAWGYCGHDHYVGYVRIAALSKGGERRIAPTHRVTAPIAPRFAGADIKTPVRDVLPGGALVAGMIEGDFLATEGGYIHLRHLTPVSAKGSDWVVEARAWIGAPYVWGGRGGGGLDCSGLVQVALGACGLAVPRDSDQQAGAIGRGLAADEALARGDIVCFPGHIGIMSNGETLLHANAYWMRTMEEPLADVVARLRESHADPIVARRRIEP